jgi:hypothetical protein
MAKSHVRIVSAAAVLGMLFSCHLVRAQNAELISQITEYGRLSKKDARSAAQSVSDRIKRSADSFVPIHDPIRRSMRAALFGTAPVAPGQEAVNDAKARLYLYAGLTPQTFPALFKPGPNALLSCQSDYGISEKWCEALFAAASRKSLAEIKRMSAPTRSPVSPQTAPVPTQAVMASVPAPAMAAPVQASPVTTTTISSPITANRMQQPMGTQVIPVRSSGLHSSPVAQRPGVKPQPSAISTAEQYKASRAKYLASFKERRAETEKKNQTAAAPPKESVPAASKADQTPRSNSANPVAALASSNVEAEALKSLEQPSKTASESPPDKASSEPSKKVSGGLDPLISDLLSDPLSKGKSGKSK